LLALTRAIGVERVVVGTSRNEAGCPGACEADTHSGKIEARDRECSAN
jgi:hypothetical protein